MNEAVNREHQGRRLEQALELLNSEPTEELLTGRLEEVSDDGALARLGPALFARRAEIGSFNDLGDLEGVDGLDEDGVASLIDSLTLPNFEFEKETLESVRWVHGSALTIERPEAFGSIQRRRHGIRVTSFRRTLTDSDPQLPGFSWAHMSIPVPSYDLGKRFHVDSVLFNFVGSPQPFGIQGQPLATPYEIEVWDGHHRIAEERMPYLSAATNRYVRVPVDSGWKLRYGLSVSFRLFVMAVPEQSELSFTIDIGAVGVELVTRTGLVVTETFN